MNRIPSPIIILLSYLAYYFGGYVLFAVTIYAYVMLLLSSIPEHLACRSLTLPKITRMRTASVLCIIAAFLSPSFLIMFMVCSMGLMLFVATFRYQYLNKGAQNESA